MFKIIRNLRLFWWSLLAALLVVLAKYWLSYFNLELIEQSSLHNSVLSSVIFVLGFLLSATIADYKESERIPSDFTANIVDLYDDAVAIHGQYPVFDVKAYRKQLYKIAHSFGDDARVRTHDARRDIRALNQYFAAMEVGKVPPNFIVKLKQQQTILLRHRQRMNYIQRIRFIPSATILARSIVIMAVALLLATSVDPFYGGLAISGVLTFILVYILLLLHVIGTPFHAEGKTRDDVSLFLIKDAANYLKNARDT